MDPYNIPCDHTSPEDRQSWDPPQNRVRMQALSQSAAMEKNQSSSYSYVQLETL